jgi:hypothetical protein
VGAFLRFVVLVVLGAVLGHAARPRSRTSPETPKPSARRDHDAVEVAVFVYDAVARVNEGLVGNIDAIDTVLTAILAGALAAVLFTADKLADLPHAPGICALVLFCCSALTCALGYFVGLWSGVWNLDGIRPRNFIADVVKEPGLALLGAIRAQIEAGETNMTIRLYKRVSALIAVLLLIGGVASVAVARWAMVVVY